MKMSLAIITDVKSGECKRTKINDLEDVFIVAPWTRLFGSRLVIDIV